MGRHARTATHPSSAKTGRMPPPLQVGEAQFKNTVWDIILEIASQTVFGHFEHLPLCLNPP
jgi:hypothetical protein